MRLGVLVPVGVDVSVGVPVSVGMEVGVTVGVSVGVPVGVVVGVLVGVEVGVAVGVLVGVAVGVIVPVEVGKIVGVLVCAITDWMAKRPNTDNKDFARCFFILFTSLNVTSNRGGRGGTWPGATERIKLRINGMRYQRQGGLHCARIWWHLMFISRGTQAARPFKSSGGTPACASAFYPVRPRALKLWSLRWGGPRESVS